ncbi:DUF2017 domain-containing protein [Microbacterium sp. LRZ72]|uniref:DUF2017 family protein n=1 Tax=Microbacterium sp. LRZ72 TaxID=2942481 RepID=UPI0029BF0043|nr:DUF2017 family protein [Microbacterium sp. LRZ72]MDX2375538.1 DUF2017 domain-containing protein [Microbacterium sp. LRZ72]
MTAETIVLVLTRIEARNLADLVAQFSELLEETAESSDPAVRRLVPDAYSDDTDAAAEFRRATQGDLLERRQHDALRVLADLAPAFGSGDENPSGGTSDDEEITISLDRDTGWAWMRTLTSIRLVIAERLGIHDERDAHPEDERFAVFDWLGFRLEGLVRALSD